MSSKVTSPVIGLVSGLVVGLVTCEASAATEELIVYGATPRSYASAEETLRTDMRAYVRDLNERLKAAVQQQLEEDLKQLSAPKIHLASGEVATRG